ncbi:MAG TPA: hypothetical protein VGG74_24500 [Kofleriaceae bacterium]|jgi:hypothetical protein
MLPAARVVRDDLTAPPPAPLSPAEQLEADLHTLAKANYVHQARRAAITSIVLFASAAIVAVVAIATSHSAAQTRVQQAGQPGGFETFVADYLWLCSAGIALGGALLAVRAIAAWRRRERGEI